MAIVKCFYCDLLLPQNTLNSHLRSKHAPPSATDAGNFYRNFAIPLAIPPESIPTNVPNTPPENAAQFIASANPSPAPIRGVQSTLFVDWLKKNTTQSSNYVTADDAVRSRVIRTDQPQKTAVALKKAVRYDVQEIVGSFDGLSDGVHEAAYEYVRVTHVPALATFVFLHLSLCFPNNDRLGHFHQNMRKYQMKGEEWCILHYAKIRDFLYGLYLQVGVILLASPQCLE
ncbi:hypothetical protein SCLCIDRAFT_712575 [Scleroderma citrinum Foug A]|uniref:Uncharacterized protein n=1 Tax=Scleroderma citrinum Foug A TaxID=1036808 RepID=A0A0C3AX53_9AGAM|nr:hypothetical protein SCLCIDRAFT_712575 [Scleroderma citrinum Foug A]